MARYVSNPSAGTSVQTNSTALSQTSRSRYEIFWYYHLYLSLVCRTLRPVYAGCALSLLAVQYAATGLAQADKAAIERPRRHTTLNIKEEQELALLIRQMISGIIPKWQEANGK
eukprot:6186213-Pleurochrysis_carterae.AAC.9